MCGINGLLALGPTEPARLQALVARMNDAIAHRGPDDEGVLVRLPVALGHRRLAILDLSPAGHQPMHNEDGTLSLVFNGEIYNYLELAAELRAAGHVFVSNTDSEVILHAYEEWGEDCLQRFNGMFAFALWDARTQRLFAARDRLGVKPFFIAKGPDFIAFSSEIAGLRAVLPLDHANLAKLHDYLAYGYRTNDGQTLFEGVIELPPAHCLRWAPGERELPMRRYWQLPAQAAEPLEAGATEAYAHLLRDALRLRFRSDVPVALLQSGGIDSSVLCTLVDDELAAGRLGQHEVLAFTAIHPGHPFDESLAVRELMKVCPRVRSVELQPGGAALAEDFFAYVDAMQEPTGSAASYAHWVLMRRLRAEGINVVLNGQGADEALAGYGRYVRGYRLLDLLLRQPSRLIPEALAMRRNMASGWGGLMAQTAKAMLGRRAASKARGWWSEQGLRVLQRDFRAAHDAHLPELGMDWQGHNLDRHLRSQMLDYGFNQILHYEDQSSMSHGVEIRSPFVDYRLIEMAFRLPDDAKFSGGLTKRILREAFAGRVPAAILQARTKLGFAIPLESWLQEPAMRAFVQQLLTSPAFRSRRIWDSAALARRLQDPQALRRGFPVWRYLMAELWMQRFGISNG